MKLEDLDWWDFSKTPTEGCEIQCPECEVFSNYEFWVETEVGCDLCGEHAAIQCPECGCPFDHIYGPTFNVK